MAPARTVALAVGFLAAALPAPALAVDSACTKQGYGGAERVVTTPRPSGYQVTAVYGDGVYEASRCDGRRRSHRGPDGRADRRSRRRRRARPVDVHLTEGRRERALRRSDGPGVGGGVGEERRAGQGRRHRAAEGRRHRRARRAAGDAARRGASGAGGPPRRASRAGHRRLHERRVRALRPARPLAGGALHVPHQRAVVRQQREDAVVDRRRAQVVGRRRATTAASAIARTS